jgi:hypothetical protein
MILQNHFEQVRPIGRILGMLGSSSALLDFAQYVLEELAENREHPEKLIDVKELLDGNKLLNYLMKELCETARQLKTSTSYPDSKYKEVHEVYRKLNAFSRSIESMQALSFSFIRDSQKEIEEVSVLCDSVKQKERRLIFKSLFTDGFIIVLAVVIISIVILSVIF